MKTELEFEKCKCLFQDCPYKEDDTVSLLIDGDWNLSDEIQSHMSASAAAMDELEAWEMFLFDGRCLRAEQTPAEGRSLLQAGNLDALVDSTLGSNYMEAAMRKVVEVGFKSVESTVESSRPIMTEVVVDLEDALEKERELATGAGDGTPTVTLGSELFT